MEFFMKKKILVCAISFLSSVGMTYTMQSQEPEEVTSFNHYEVWIHKISNFYNLQGYFKKGPCSEAFSDSSRVSLTTKDVNTEEFKQKVAILTSGFDIRENEKEKLESDLEERCYLSLDELLEKLKDFQSSEPV
jgi:hypothetical protein